MSRSGVPVASQASRGERLLLLLQRFAPLLMVLIITFGVGMIVWHLSAQILLIEEQQPKAGIARVEGGKFLGLTVED